jgi:hypothetical protein
MVIMTYTIVTLPTADGIRFYIQDQNGKRRQGGCATREKAEKVVARLQYYDQTQSKGTLPDSSLL